VLVKYGDHNLITKIRDERRRVRLGVLRERRELPSEVRGGAPATIDIFINSPEKGPKEVKYKLQNN